VSAAPSFPKFDLNLLVAFHALITERSVTRAAERMSVSQPAMSAALSKLRKLLGDPLLVRKGRDMVPTAVAMDLIGPISKSLANFEEVLTRRSAFNPATDAATFTVLASDYVAIVLLRDVLRTLAEEAPHVRFILHPISSLYVDQLRTGYADLAILPLEIADARSGFRAAALFTDRLVGLVDEDNERVGEVMTRNDLLEMPYLAYDGGSLPSSAQMRLADAGIQRQIDVTTQSFVVTASMIDGTNMFTIIHKRLADHMISRARVRAVTLPMETLPVREMMFWSNRTEDTPAHQWIRSKIAEAGQRLMSHKRE